MFVRYVDYVGSLESTLINEKMKHHYLQRHLPSEICQEISRPTCWTKTAPTTLRTANPMTHLRKLLIVARGESTVFSISKQVVKVNFRKFWISDSSCIQGSLFVLEASRITHGMLTSQAYQSWNHATNHLCSMHSEYSTGENIVQSSHIKLLWWASCYCSIPFPNCIVLMNLRCIQACKRGKTRKTIRWRFAPEPDMQVPNIGKHHFKPRANDHKLQCPVSWN